MPEGPVVRDGGDVGIVPRSVPADTESAEGGGVNEEGVHVVGPVARGGGQCANAGWPRGQRAVLRVDSPGFGPGIVGLRRGQKPAKWAGVFSLVAVVASENHEDGSTGRS